MMLRTFTGTTLGAAAVALVLAAGSALAAANSNDNYGYHSHVRHVSKQSAVEYFRQQPVVAAHKKYRIGVLLQSLETARRQRITRGLRNQAANLNVKLVFAAVTDAGTSQLARARQLADKKLDAYIVAPEQADNLAPVLAKMRSQQAPLINLGTKRVAATVYVGPDYRDQGATAAAKLHRVLTPASRIKKLFFSQRAKIAQIHGPLADAHVIARIEGFDQGVGSRNALEEVDSVPGGASAESAYAATERLIRENPDLQGIFAGDNDMALGAAQASQAASKKIAVVGVGESPALLSAVRRRGLVASISTMPYYQGVWAVESAVRLLEGHAVPTWLTAPNQLLTEHNLHIYYDDNNKTRPDLYRKR